MKPSVILVLSILLINSCSENSDNEDLNTKLTYAKFLDASFDNANQLINDSATVKFNYLIEDSNYVYKKLECKTIDNEDSPFVEEYIFKIQLEHQPNNNNDQRGYGEWKFYPTKKGTYGIYLFNSNDDTLKYFLSVDYPEKNYTLTSKDYEFIVDSVKNTDDLSQYVGDYDFSEFYYGANFYYNNFDLRIEPRINSGQSEFKSLSEEEANEIIWERVVEALKIVLNERFPNKERKLKYFIQFDVYDGSNDTYKAKFMVPEENDGRHWELNYINKLQ